MWLGKFDSFALNKVCRADFPDSGAKMLGENEEGSLQPSQGFQPA